MDDDGPCNIEELREELGGVEGEIVAQQGEGGAKGGSPSKKRKRSRKTSSPVWEHFNQGEVREDGSYDAICKYCGQKYEMGNQKSTSSMKGHIKVCKKIPNDKRQKVGPMQKYLQTSKNEGIFNFNGMISFIY